MSELSSSNFDLKEYYTELMSAPLFAEYFNGEDLEAHQEKFFELKKYILLSKYYEEVQNIRDEYVLDGFIEKYKEDLNWDDFLQPIGLGYKNKKIRKEVRNKLKLYGSITYSQVYQMKIYYDKEFHKFIESNMNRDQQYLISPAFFYYCYTQNADTSSDIYQAIEKYKTSNMAIVYCYLIDYCHLPKEVCREYMLR